MCSLKTLLHVKDTHLCLPSVHFLSLAVALLQVHTLRHKIIKISQARYQATCHRLRQLHQTKKTK